MDEVKLALARQAAAERGLANVEVRQANVNDWAEPAAYDFVYSRLLLMHLKQPEDLLRRMWEGVRAGGVLAVEDADFDGQFCHPENAGFDFFSRMLPRVVELNGGALRAQAVAFDPHNDVAVLRVDGLDAPPLALKDPQPGAAIAIVGYPLNSPLEASAGRIGGTETVLAQDAYGRGPTRRVVTSLGGAVQHGNSGGPAVDASGAVQSTVFAARATGSGGYGVPASVVRRDVESASGPVSTGPCVR